MIKDFTNNEKKERRCRAACTQHQQPQEDWSTKCFIYGEKTLLAGEVEVILSWPVLLQNIIGKRPHRPGWRIRGLLHEVPGGIAQMTASDLTGTFCSVRGSSDGRLEHGDVGSFDEVFVLPVDQRVPLVKILL